MAFEPREVAGLEPVEVAFSCPYCWQRISFIVERVIDGRHAWIEDCEVCCRPIEAHCVVEAGEIASFETQRVS